jgi:hypothetical protein
MAKFTFSRISSMVNAPSAINGVITEIESAFDTLVSRDGAAPNQLTADVDMNSKRILNLPAPASSTEPVTLSYFQTTVQSADAQEAANEAAASAVEAATSATAAQTAQTNAETAETNAEAAQAAAEVAQLAAEAAASASAADVDLYDDIATGLAAVADGEQFGVREGDYIARYRRDSVSTYTDLNARYPVAPSRVLPDGAAGYFDFDAGNFYWDSAWHPLAALTDNGDGSFSLNDAFLSSADITFIVEFSVDSDPTASFSGTLFSMSNASNQRVEIPAYNPGNTVNGQVRRLMRGYFSDPGNFVSPLYTTSIDSSSYRGLGRHRIGFIVENGSAIISAVDAYPPVTSGLTPAALAQMTKFGFGRNIRFNNDPIAGATLHKVFLYDSALTAEQLEAKIVGTDVDHEPIHVVGDSYLNLHQLTDEIRDLAADDEYTPITQDGVGSSSISEQAVRFTGESPVSAVSAANGSSVTLAITNGGSNRSPAFYAIGDSVDVSGMVPEGYNGTYTLTGATNTSITFACTETGALTTAGFVTKNGINSRHWDDTLVIMDGGFDGDGPTAMLALTQMLRRLTHDRWLYVQSNPQVGISTGSTRTDWETRDALMRAFCGDRYVPTLARMQSLMLKTPREWAASTKYYINDVVLDTTHDTLYRCIVEHTSTGTEPIAANADIAKWAILGRDEKVPAWVASRAYQENTIVLDTSDDLYYRCITAHTSSGALPISTNADVAKWHVVKHEWAASRKYYAGDLAIDTSLDGFAIYKCGAAHTSSGSLPISTNADAAKWVRSYERENVVDGLWPGLTMQDTIHPTVYHPSQHLGKLIHDALHAKGWI